MALTDPFPTTFAGAYRGIGAYGQALQDIAQAYAGRKKEEREAKREIQKTKMDEWLEMIKAGYSPTEAERYTPADIRGMSIERIAEIIPKTGFTPGEFPKKEGVLKSPSGQLYEPLKGMNITNLKYVKSLVDLRNALAKGKPTEFQIEKLAQTEASRRMGGSLMFGITETRRKEYVDLVESLKKEYRQQYGLEEAEPEIEEPGVEELETGIDWQDINF